MAKVDSLACGQCGGKHFTLRHVQKKGDGRVGGGDTFAGHIRATCIKCKSRSTIGVQAALVVEGTLCGGWS